MTGMVRRPALPADDPGTPCSRLWFHYTGILLCCPVKLPGDAKIVPAFLFLFENQSLVAMKGGIGRVSGVVVRPAIGYFCRFIGAAWCRMPGFETTRRMRGGSYVDSFLAGVPATVYAAQCGG